MQGRVAVLGAGGFLGQALVGLLRAHGTPVTGMARHLPWDWPEGTHFYLGDARVPERLAQALRRCDAVVNAVSGPPGVIEGVARSLLECRLRGWQGRIVQVSTLAVFSGNTGPCLETTLATPRPGHAYARAKLAAEGLLAGQALILRPGCLYGPGAPVWVDRLCRLLLAGRLGPLGSAGEGVAPLLHVQDLARCITAALQAPAKSGIWNLPGPEPLTWNAYFAMLAAALRLPPPGAIPPARLAREIWLRGPLDMLAARAGLPASGPLTPAMRALFAQPATYATGHVPGLLPPAQHVPAAAGVPAAVREFWIRFGPRPRHAQAATPQAA